MAKPSVKTLRNRADKLWSLAVRQRDGKCRRCGRTSPEVVLHGAHIISRRYKAIRWEPINGLCLCAGCHMWAHRFPVDFDWWAQELIGEDIYIDLRKRAVEYAGTLKRVDLEEVIEQLEAS